MSKLLYYFFVLVIIKQILKSESSYEDWLMNLNGYFGTLPVPVP